MSDKEMYTREEFEEMRLKKAQNMADDKSLQDDALDVLVRADRHNWIHQTNWFGEPLLQLPQDMFAFQEIIWRTRPDFIIEVGVAWGGSVLFNSTICEAMGHGQVVGIDIYIPDDLVERLNNKGKVSDRLHLIKGSSIDDNIVSQVKNIVGDSKRTFVILDSHHTKDHVLQELKIYSSFVGKGCYMICGDTIIDRFPVQKHRLREWGPGNSPMDALKCFLEFDKRFLIDNYFDNKLLMTCNPCGFLRAMRDSEGE